MVKLNFVYPRFSPQRLKNGQTLLPSLTSILSLWHIISQQFFQFPRVIQNVHKDNKVRHDAIQKFHPSEIPLLYMYLSDKPTKKKMEHSLRKKKGRVYEIQSYPIFYYRDDPIKDYSNVRVIPIRPYFYRSFSG